MNRQKLRRTIPKLLLWLLMGIPILACSDDDDRPGEPVACDNFQADYEEVMERLNLFINTPTTANCEAYKNAMTDFYENYGDCSYWSTEHQQGLDELDEMDCNMEGSAVHDIGGIQVFGSRWESTSSVGVTKVGGPLFPQT